jgi:hypothetical protein
MDCWKRRIGRWPFASRPANDFPIVFLDRSRFESRTSQELTRNDNVIRQMYNVIYFDLFTIESKRGEILCIIPKFHVCSRVSKPTRKLVVQLREVRCLVSTDKSTTLGYAWEKKYQERRSRTNCGSIGYPHNNIAKYCEHGKPAQIFGVT